MDQVPSLRPFVPARDFALPKRFYQALGFRLSHEGGEIALLKTGGFSFILQDFCNQELAENLMVQLMVRDADAWWRGVDAAALVQEFGVKPPRAPAVQPWGLKVGFPFDPSGVLWHVAEAPF
jgi:uncharacterized glyoxalase superfamily protein PhnB